MIVTSLPRAFSSGRAKEIRLDDPHLDVADIISADISVETRINELFIRARDCASAAIMRRETR
jgi:hypothetical protein